LQSCTVRAYEAETFENLPEKTIAILPYEVVFEGRTPRRFTQRDLEMFAIGDSQLFQASLYRSIIERERRNKRFKLTIQDVNDTNFLLAKADISIRDSWYKDPVELAEILGVDAVVRSSVSTKRFVSDGLAATADVTLAVLDALSGESSDTGTTTTGEVFVKASIIDIDGTLVWSASENVATDYSFGSKRAVQFINRRIIRRMRITN
ncbi:MAG: hypothetical protein AAGK97_09715, partial [Bacteroidota bacterium]